MNKTLLSILAVLAIAVGFITQKTMTRQDAPKLPAAAPAMATELIGTQRPDFSLADLEGQATSITQWEGKIILINFWATWCPPCRREIPEFIEVLQEYEKRGFQIVGIAIDSRDAVMGFIDAIGADYPQLIGGQDATNVSKQYGNHYGGLPYSVLIDRKGLIQFIKPGQLHRVTLEQQLEKLL